ncbi:MAG: hypothetical protein A3J62_00175 [Candidatus Buchananbacteria bacterium RIFCSPHIGHO2_02_FULL_38_8]|uniref:Proteinase inhibitor I42 chagasin domain-containing protein n=1 Tax=Candidatus Buchananbacteria bacterium RIFCSPHIGHO2_02_FULL_38_8 TaxID=1797538 RepID=A0A1G1Y5R2_9BACT|nr:hypothetical protein [uncultured bacterium]OGY47591.1 MAG: hypothetical protein A3J62_00175 [Candidatus Buchananbacteria bacterium RIFCSPHIGHO2_02_FULL_38_8]
MKRILPLSLLIIISLGLVACKSNKQAGPSVVPETGRVLDITKKNNEEITANPGDVLYLNLTGVGDSGLFWVAISPTSSDCLTLKDHQVQDLNQPNTTSTSKWWFKVEKKCGLDLQFDYGKIEEEPQDSFKVKIISQ